MKSFVGCAKKTDATLDHTHTKRYGVLDAGFGAEVAGGFLLAAKHLGNRRVVQYQGSSARPEGAMMQTTKEALREQMEETVFSPAWKSRMCAMQYEGASQIMCVMQNVFTWKALSDAVAHTDIDRMVREYVNDPAMQAFFSEYNPYAYEEIARRFLELHERGIWEADEEVLADLRRQYLSAEGDVEAWMNDGGGDLQGGDIEIVTHEDVEDWGQQLLETDQAIREVTG